MTVKAIPICPGKERCVIFKTPESFLATIESPPTFENMLTATEMVKVWRRIRQCPFMIKDSGKNDGEFFRQTICSIAAKPCFSMDAVSRATGFSKTRVSQIEGNAIRKIKKAMKTDSMPALIVQA